MCRSCGADLELTLVDLGMSPPSQSLLTADSLGAAELFYPLHVRACTRCWLVQLPKLVDPREIFTEYAYFSSYSSSWVEHARRYVEMIRARLDLRSDDFVVELASNDGYLLQHFVGSGIPILGIDPAANVVQAAAQRGVPTLVEFFGRETGERLVAEGRLASLIVGNNVLAQVPDLRDFIVGIRLLLAREGTATFEFPHRLHLFDRVEYDTIYHEHYSYFSFTTLTEILGDEGLSVYDVEQLATHGGSLRIYVQHADGPYKTRVAVTSLIALEAKRGLRMPDRFEQFAVDVKESKFALLELLISLQRDGKRVVGYGAPAKANTLLNYCGIRTELLEYTVDRNPYKHGMYTPGTHIPIHPVERINEDKPDFIVVFPWNLIGEIASQLAYVSEWGAKLVVPIPRATVIDPGEGAEERLAHALLPLRA